MLQPEINDRDHKKGAESAPVQLVEYGDYQCPHCRRAHPVVQQLIAKYEDSLLFVFRNFPLYESHKMAYPAAISTEAAAPQGLFWAMHDAIFEHQDKLGEGMDGLLDIAETVGLDLSYLQEQWENKELQQKVEQDFESGIESGVGGTPTFFLNGEKHKGSPDELDEAIARLLAA
jgi:protein-disulfide isomerase